MNFEEFYPKLEEMVTTIASEYGAKGRRYGADHEDFRQEFMVWLLAHQVGVGQCLSENPDEGLDYVARALRIEGNVYLRELGAQVAEYDPCDPWHGRRAVSNASARARVSQSYNDGGPE